MRKYITGEGSGENISIDVGGEFGPVDMIRILSEIKESYTPQVFGAKKGGSIWSNVELRDGIIYFGACDGNFYAVDSKTGNESWRFNVGDIMTTFAMDNERIYIASYDKCLHAISIYGKHAWIFKADGKLGNLIEKDGRIYFGTDGGNFYCVGSDGKLRWRFATSSIIGGFPAVHNGMVFFGDFDGRFYALDAESGRQLWVFKAKGGLGGCRIHRNMLFFACRKGVFYALDMNGKEIWKRLFESGLVVDMLYSPYGNLVFASSMDGGLYALDVKDGSIIWKFDTPEAVDIFMVKGGDTIYFGDLGGKFYANDLTTGKPLWSFSTNGPVTGGIVTEGGRVYFGCWDCNLYCLDAGSGSLVWKFRTPIGSMSDYVTDTRADKVELSVTIKLPEEESKGASMEEMGLTDYGEFSGAYIDKEKSDYVKSGKRGYMKKKEF